MPKHDPSLPATRPFVAQLHTDIQPEQGECKGRVEHIVSLQAARLNSAEGLLAFRQRILSDQEVAEAAVEADNH